MCGWKAAAVLALAGVVAAEAAARNPAYYGTRRATSARHYSGQYQAQFPNVVPTFSLPVYGGGYYAPYRGGFGRGYYPAYQQPVVIYPPAFYYGY